MLGFFFLHSALSFCSSALWSNNIRKTTLCIEPSERTQISYSNRDCTSIVIFFFLVDKYIYIYQFIFRLIFHTNRITERNWKFFEGIWSLTVSIIWIYNISNCVVITLFNFSSKFLLFHHLLRHWTVNLLFFFFFFLWSKSPISITNILSLACVCILYIYIYICPFLFAHLTNTHTHLGLEGKKI
jgi:hypothetical protein